MYNIKVMLLDTYDAKLDPTWFLQYYNSAVRPSSNDRAEIKNI